MDLDGDEMLAADLAPPRYALDSAGRRVVEPKAETKKRLGRSPDRADAVLMAFAVKRELGPFPRMSEPSRETRALANAEVLSSIGGSADTVGRVWESQRTRAGREETARLWEQVF